MLITYAVAALHRDTVKFKASIQNVYDLTEIKFQILCDLFKNFTLMPFLNVCNTDLKLCMSSSRDDKEQQGGQVQRNLT